jgi:hypothetical protein
MTNQPNPSGNSNLPGVNVLLMGPTGSGKTYSIRTLIEAGITPFVIATEPGIQDTLGDIPPDKLHWHYVGPATVPWKTLIDTANKINKLSYEGLTKAVMSKNAYTQWIDFLTVCNSYTCDRTGKNFGDVANWQTDRALIIDGMTGLAKMAMDLVIGARPTASPGDWGVAMKNLENTLLTLTNSTQCWLIVTAHLEREKDEVTGGVKLMPSTLGTKLSPKVPNNFGDVILCQQAEGSWTWSTASTHQVDLKARHLPIRNNLPPSFKGIVEDWKKKGGVITPTKGAKA